MAVQESEIPAVDGASGAAAVPRGWFTRTFESLGDRHLRTLWIVAFANSLGPTMSGTTQGVVAYDLTGSNSAVAAVVLGQGLAMAVVAPVGGALSDRLSKRPTMLGAQAICALIFALLGVAIATDLINLALLVGGSFLIGCTFVFLRSLRTSYLSDLAPPAVRANAVALQQLAQSVPQIAGPPLAGILIGWSLMGAAGANYVIGGSFVLAMVIAWQLPPAPARAQAAGSPGIWADSWIGLKYGWTNRELRWVLVAFFVFTALGMPYQSLMPGYVSSVHGEDTSTVGWILGAAAISGLVTSFALAGAAGSPRAPAYMLGSLGAVAAGLVGLAAAPSFGASIPAAMVVGVGFSGAQLLSMAVALHVSEGPYLGRVASLTMLGFGAQGLAALPTGALADGLGERTVLAAMAAALVVAVVLLAAWRARLRAVPSPSHVITP